MGGAAIIIWVLVFFGIFYFIAVRPQRRQRQAHQEMVAMLKKGDEIVTIGGMFGVIRRLGDDWIEIEISKGTRVRFLKKAISQIVSEEEDEEEYEDELEPAADEAEWDEGDAVEDGPDEPEVAGEEPSGEVAEEVADEAAVEPAGEAGEEKPA
jgi:preprotein translocase subunit YajC